MNDLPTTIVDINGVRLPVPTYRDPDSTKAIATEVSAILRAIEQSSDRIDTQRFALEACMQIATDLARERDRASETEGELGIQLASINASVETLLKLLE